MYAYDLRSVIYICQKNLKDIWDMIKLDLINEQELGAEFQYTEQEHAKMQQSLYYLYC